MSKEFKSFCLTSQVQDCPLPKREPGRGIWAHCPSPSRAVGSTAGFQLLRCHRTSGIALSSSPLCWVGTSLRWAFTQRPPKGRIHCAAESRSIAGHPRERWSWSQWETSQSYTSRRITPTPESENEMIIAPWEEMLLFRGWDFFLVMKRLGFFFSVLCSYSFLALYLSMQPLHMLR